MTRLGRLVRSNCGYGTWLNKRSHALQRNCRPLFSKAALFPHYLASGDAAIFGSADKERGRALVCRAICQL